MPLDVSIEAVGAPLAAAALKEAATSPTSRSPSRPGDAFFAARDLLLELREDLDAACARFRWPELDGFNWALDYFDVIAADNERPALVLADASGAVSTFSFAALAVRSNRVANLLRRHGVCRGDRLLIMLGNVAPLWELTLAALKLGAVISPATTLLTADDLADRVVRGDMRHVVTDAGGVERLDTVAGSATRFLVDGEAPGWVPYTAADAEPDAFTPDRPAHPGDPFLLYFTSGTTAKPKMVLHTQASYPVGHLSTLYWIGLRAGDLHWNISSPGWAKHAWSCVFAPWNAGATVFVHQVPRFDAAGALDALVRHRVTTLCAPPTVWRLLIQEDLAAHRVSLREVVSAGEPLNPEVIEQVERAWGLTIRDGYGQTETTAMLGNPPGQPVRPGSMGRPLPGYRMALIDPTGASDAEVAEGEVAAALHPRPLPLMQGYLDHPERTRELLGGSWYRTSDVARRDDDGYYWYVGRADDVFKSSDYRVSPFEIESALLEHEAVVEAAVVPSPHEIRLAVPKAFVVLRPGVAPDAATALALLRFCRERLSPYLRVRRLEFAELPKTVSGKIRRVELRRLEEDRAARGERGEREHHEEDFPELGARAG
jgi:acetyl-CoA synthetase